MNKTKLRFSQGSDRWKVFKMVSYEDARTNTQLNKLKSAGTTTRITKENCQGEE